MHDREVPHPPRQPILITLPACDWNIIIAALVEAPYRVAAPLIAEIVRQARGQPGEDGDDA